LWVCWVSMRRCTPPFPLVYAARTAIFFFFRCPWFSLVRISLLFFPSLATKLGFLFMFCSRKGEALFVRCFVFCATPGFGLSLPRPFSSQPNLIRPRSAVLSVVAQVETGPTFFCGFFHLHSSLAFQFFPFRIFGPN